jgi:hypothetical protein
VVVGVVIDGEESEIAVEDDVMEVESEVVVVDSEVEAEPVGSKVNGMVVLGGSVVVSKSGVIEEPVEDVAAV